MSAAMEEATGAKLYRCGFCGCDFLSFESCLIHLTSHASEQDRTAASSSSSSSSAAAAAVRGDLPREEVIGESSAVQGRSLQCSSAASVPAEISSTHVRSESSSSSSCVMAPVVKQPERAAVQSAAEAPGDSSAVGDPGEEEPPAAVGERTSRPLQTSGTKDVQVAASQPSSIVVQTSSVGAYIMNTRLSHRGTDAEDHGGDSEELTPAQHRSQNVREVKVRSLLQEVACEGREEEQGAGDDGGHLEDRQVSACHDDARGIARSWGKTSQSSSSRDKNDRPYTCSQCPARYRFLSSLSVHKKRHSGAEPYHCKMCKKKFWHPTNLRVHERVHSQKRLFHCQVCGHGFNQANDLRIHSRIHTGETPLTCSVENCGRAFRDPACLRRHINKHRGVQPHIACDQCGARFFHPSGLARHYKRHTGQKDHQCPMCGTAFARGDTLKLHMRIHSGLKPYSCSVCLHAFSDRSYCRRHLAKHHASLNPRVLSTLQQGGHALPKEEEEEEEEGGGGGDGGGGDDDDDGVMETVSQQEAKPQPTPPTVQKATPALIVPVDVHLPESGESSDIPYASIEIEIPESDLVGGDGSEEMVYQYGDMLITISRSAVGRAADVSSAPNGTSQDVEEAATNPDPSSSVVAVPLSLQQTEHQYSRGRSVKGPKKPGSAPSGEASGVAGRLRQGSGGLNPLVVVKAGGVTVPQPLSEYNEMVTSTTTTTSTANLPRGVESRDVQGKEVQFRILPGSRDKQRNARVGEKRWRCADCDAAFFHQAELKRHRTKHTGELPYQCSICGKKVRDPSNLKRHVRTHTGERPYSCYVCGKTFRQAGHLSAHVRIHTGQRPYRCTLCPATFIEANHLRYHQKVHAGIKPYRCPHCPLSFIRNAELKRHSHVHAEGSQGNLHCTLCPAKFFRSDALRHHLSKKHEQSLPYRCEVCSQSFSRQSLLERHCAKTGHTSTNAISANLPHPPKSDAENSVVADALCELAAGRRRSGSQNGKEPGCLASPDTAGSGHHSNSGSLASVRAGSGLEGSNPPVIVAGEAECVLMATREDMETGAVVSSSSPQRGNSSDVVTVQGLNMALNGHRNRGGGGGGHFVRRVVVDGGSVCGARVVLVESDRPGSVDNLMLDSPQTAGALEVTETQGSTCQAGDSDKLIPPHHTHSPWTVVTGDAVSQPEQEPQTGLEDPGASDQSSAVIINCKEQTGELAVPPVIKTEVMDQFPNSSLSTVVVSEGVYTVVKNGGGAAVGNSSHEEIQLVLQGHSDDTSDQEHSTTLTFEASPCSAKSSLQSTMQSLVSGEMTLETVTPLEGGRGRRGGKRGGGGEVVVKEEPGQVVAAPEQKEPGQVVAPLRTRSGRERKVRVKLSL